MPSKCMQNFDTIGLKNSPYAWVYMANSETTLLHILVSAQSAKLHGSTADIVILWFGHTCPQPCIVAAVDGIGNAQLRVVGLPLGPADVQNKMLASILTKINKWWDWVKLEAFNLTEYSKVVFLDGDTLFLENLDTLFSMPAGTHTDAPKSPFNSGLFVLEPSHADYLTLLDTVRKGNYDLKHSWNSHFYDIDGLYRPRSYAPFYGAETTQGLLYFFFRELKKSYKVLPRDQYHYQGTNDTQTGISMVHFNICDKPVPGVVPERCAGFHRKWQLVFDTLHLDQCYK